MKKTSDAWLLSHLSQQPSEPAHYIEYCIGFSDERFDLHRVHFEEKFGPWCPFHVRGLMKFNFQLFSVGLTSFSGFFT